MKEALANPCAKTFQINALVGIGGTFSEVKKPGREADHSPPSGAKVKNR
jgi:hypothetical protein